MTSSRLCSQSPRPQSCLDSDRRTISRLIRPRQNLRKYNLNSIRFGVNSLTTLVSTPARCRRARKSLQISRTANRAAALHAANGRTSDTRHQNAAAVDLATVWASISAPSPKSKKQTVKVPTNRPQRPILDPASRPATVIDRAVRANVKPARAELGGSSQIERTMKNREASQRDAAFRVTETMTNPKSSQVVGVGKDVAAYGNAFLTNLIKVRAEVTQKRTRTSPAHGQLVHVGPQSNRRGAIENAIRVTSATTMRTSLGDSLKDSSMSTRFTAITTIRVMMNSVARDRDDAVGAGVDVAARTAAAPRTPATRIPTTTSVVPARATGPTTRSLIRWLRNPLSMTIMRTMRKSKSFDADDAGARVRAADGDLPMASDRHQRQKRMTMPKAVPADDREKRARLMTIKIHPKNATCQPGSKP